MTAVCGHHGLFELALEGWVVEREFICLGDRLAPTRFNAGQWAEEASFPTGASEAKGKAGAKLA